MGHVLTIAADGQPSVGLGHLARCSALAGALGELGIAARTLALGAVEGVTLDGVAWEPWGGELPPGPLVLDTYGERPSGVFGCLVDGADAPDGCEVAIGLMVRDDGERRLGGVRHLMLRRDYWAPVPRVVPVSARHALVTLGGTDPGGRGPRIAGELAAGGLEVTLVRGPSAPRDEVPPRVRVLDAPASLAAVLAAADVAVTGAGQTLWETCAVGTPVVAVVVAENQRPGAELADREGLAVVAGDHAAAAAALALAADHGRRAALAARGQAAVDGQGARRVASVLARLLNVDCAG